MFTEAFFEKLENLLYSHYNVLSFEFLKIIWFPRFFFSFLILFKL